MPEAARSELLAASLAAASLPAWRKAYLDNLIASGDRFAASGNGRGAEYCYAKVEEALRALPPAAGPLAAPAEDGEAALETSAGASSRSSDRVRRQWRQDRLQLAEDVLSKHGGRLSSLENQSYRERLARLRQAAAQPSQAGKADAGLLDLRRRLYQRVLKAQKIALVRKRGPAPERFRAPVPVSATAAAWQPVIGPYNDRYNLEGLLDVIGGADPAWVEEFLDLYRGLLGLNVLAAPAGTRKK
jgi:hypothetical protein